MQKDFDRWNENKKALQNIDKEVLFREREIWWCSLGVNIGFEQDGVNEYFERPVLILKKFSKDVSWVLPITTSEKSSRFYFQIKCLDSFSSVILSQIRLVSSKRLLRRMAAIDEVEFGEITQKFRDLLPIQNGNPAKSGVSSGAEAI